MCFETYTIVRRKMIITKMIITKMVNTKNDHHFSTHTLAKLMFARAGVVAVKLNDSNSLGDAISLQNHLEQERKTV